MALAVTSNYAGKAAGFYISAALRQANSMEYLTMIENIKSSCLARKCGIYCKRHSLLFFS